MELTTQTNQPTMTSLQLVEYINEDRRLVSEQTGTKYIELLHKNFMSKVPEVLGENQSAKFLAHYIDSRNREQSCYNFPERESILMAMSYSYSLQAKVYDQFQSMKNSIQSINPNQILSLIVDMQKQFLQLNSNVTALINNMAVKNEPRIETPNYYQTSERLEQEKLDIHLYHRITIYGKKFRSDLNQSIVKDRAMEIGMLASRISKERKIKIHEEENLDSRYSGKTRYYHQDILEEVFRLLF